MDDEPTIRTDPVHQAPERLAPSRFEEAKQDIGFHEPEPDYIASNRLRLFSVFDFFLIVAGVALVAFSYFEGAPKLPTQVNSEHSLIDDRAAGQDDNQWPRLEREHF